MEIKDFGKDTNLFIMKNKSGAYVSVTDAAASVVSIVVPDKEGKFSDVVLGYDCGEKYLSKGAYHGATVGRVANRIENACFTLDGVKYHTSKNLDGKHTLHGGEKGASTKIFDTVLCGESVAMKTILPDAEDGFPGNLQLTVKYSFDDNCRLIIEHTAVCDKKTVVNITNHAYFNLNGKGDILGHRISICADKYYPIGRNGMVTGELEYAHGVMDFRTPRIIGETIGETDEQLEIAGGYDHNFHLQDGRDLILAAYVESQESGRYMRTYTDLPCVLFYSGNFLHTHKVPGREGRLYKAHEGLCLETGYCANALKFPSIKQPILEEGETYHHTTIYEFGLLR